MLVAQSNIVKIPEYSSEGMKNLRELFSCFHIMKNGSHCEEKPG